MYLEHIQETYTHRDVLLSSKQANRQSLLQRLHGSALLPSQLSVAYALCDLLTCVLLLVSELVMFELTPTGKVSGFSGCVTSPSKLGRASVGQL